MYGKLHLSGRDLNNYSVCQCSSTINQTILSDLYLGFKSYFAENSK